MGNLASIGDRLVVKKREHDAQADEWSARLDAMDKDEPAAFAAGDAVVKERESDLAEFETDMRKLSNFPPIVGAPVLTRGGRDVSLMPVSVKQLRRKQPRAFRGKRF